MHQKVFLHPKLRVFTSVLISALLITQNFVLPTANAAVVSDSSTVCQSTVTSSTGVTIDSASVSVTLNGIYCIVKFQTVGTYAITVPGTTSTLDYLVVGGGGGGGSGGGGGGGVKQGSNISVNSISPYSVVVGAGGARGSGSGSGTNATNGGQSSFSSYSVLGGGRGGQGNQAAGSGSSGGGAQYDCTNVASCAGTGTFGQGNNGAASTHGGYGGGAGGGGAGSAGGNTILFHIGGNGGYGVISSITGSSVYYGGGGGGSINSNDNAYCGLHSPGNSDSNYYCNGTNPSLDIKGGGNGGLGGGGDGSSYGFAGGTRGQYANATAGMVNTGGGGGGTDPEDIYAGAGGSGVVVLRWVAPTNLKIITFDSNYGTSETTTQSIVSGVSTALTAGTFTRVGYIFSGWTLNADGTGTSYGDATNITTSVDTTLYAKWITGVNKEVTFNGNSSTSGSMATQTAGTATALRVNTFTRSSYTFTGWNTAANGSGYSYADSAVYAFTTNATLYAQWTAIRTSYTVTFYANAGVGATPAQTADTPTALSLSGFTRTGYNFLGWDTNWNSGSAAYIDGQSYSFNSNLSLYAIWVAQAPNVVTFDKNAVSATGSTASQTASSSTTLNTNGFTRIGYTFVSWNTAANGSGTSYQSTYTYSFAAAVTLYATWSQNFTISYSGNGANSGDTPTAQSYYVGGARLTVSNNSGNFARTGYTLVGWNTLANGSGTSYAIGGANATFSGDTTLYAQWLGSTYSILYTGNSNTSGSAPSSQSYTYGDLGITLRGNSSSLTRTGYTFNGWNSQPNGSGTAYTESQTPVTFAGDTVLFASWTANTYTLTYDLNKGTGETSTASFLYGNSTTLISPTRTGYSLSGWYDTTTAGTKVGDAGGAYSTAVSRTLYAQWVINSYTYTYNGNGGSIDTSTVTYTYGDAALTLRTPNRTSYQFNGWYTATLAGTRIGGAGDSNTPTTTQTLYAQWTQLSLVGLGSATLINSNTTSAGVGTSFSTNSGGTTVTVTYIADALPAGTVIDAYLLPNTTRAAGLIPDATNLLLSLVVAWKATDGSVPSVSAGNPITVTIVNAGIKAGAKIYILIGNAATLLGTATVDGTASVSFTDDPEIVISNPAVTPPSSGGGGSSGGGSSGGSAPAPTPAPTPAPAPTDTPAPTPAQPPKLEASVPIPYVPVAPLTVIPTGQAVVEIRTPSGALSSARKEVNISPTDPNAQVITIASSQVTLSTANANGVPNKPQNATLTLSKGDVIKFSVRGFKPSSEVSVYIFSDPILLGIVVTDTEGNYTSSFPSPDGIEVGSHTIQLVGYLMDESFATLSLPVLVIQPTVTKTLKVFFGMGKSTLTSAQHKSIKAFVVGFNKSNPIMVTIKGFVQKTARQINDEKLPQMRAKTVAIALNKYGLSRKPILSSGGYAVEKDDRARRVEVVLTIAK